jgi:hypothetical protein
MAREVFDALGAWDWMPRNHGRVTSWMGQPPVEGTSDSGRLDAGTSPGGGWGDISPNGELTIKMSGLGVCEKDVGAAQRDWLSAETFRVWEHGLDFGRPNGTERGRARFLV